MTSTTTTESENVMQEIIGKDDYGRSTRTIRGRHGYARITRMPKAAIAQGVRPYAVYVDQDRAVYECDTLTEARIIAKVVL